MVQDNISLSEYLKSLYPEQNLTEAEINEMKDRLIKFFAIGAVAMQETKRREVLIKLHNDRKET